MKKLFFIAAIAGAALVSCTKNELAPSATKQYELTFASPVTQAVTKGVALTPATYPTTENFAVFADYHTTLYANTTEFTSYMRYGDNEGVPVGHNSSATGEVIDGVTFTNWWAPIGTKKYYWPMDGYLTFAAYSPSAIRTNANISYDITNGIKLTGYTVNANTNQVDLMLSDRATDQVRPYTVANNENVGGTVNDGIHIAFKHVLSAISFAFKTAENYSDDDYVVTLKKLTINKAYTTADLTQFKEKSMTTLSLSASTYNIWSNWSNQSDNSVYNSSLTLTNSAQRLDSGDSKADILLIPQALTDVTFTMEYTVSHPDMGKTGDAQNSITYVTNPISLATSNISSWDAGTRYLYTIEIGMNEIRFAPTVTAWTNEIGGNITL